MNWLNLSLLSSMQHSNLVLYQQSANILTPIPKMQSPMDEGDFRAISLTSCLSKVLEDFVVTWVIDRVKDKIGPNQL